MGSETNNLKTKILDLQRAVAANPDSAEAHMKLGTAWLQSGVAKKAEESLRRAVEIDPSPNNLICHLISAIRFVSEYFPASRR